EIARRDRLELLQVAEAGSDGAAQSGTSHPLRSVHGGGEMILQAVKDGCRVMHLVADPPEARGQLATREGAAKEERVGAQQALERAHEHGQAVRVVERHHQDAPRLEHAVELAEGGVDEAEVGEVIERRVGHDDVERIALEGEGEDVGGETPGRWPRSGERTLGGPARDEGRDVYAEAQPRGYEIEQELVGTVRFLEKIGLEDAGAGQIAAPAPDEREVRVALEPAHDGV